MKQINKQSFIMLFMIITGLSSQLTCSANNHQITRQLTIYGDTDENEVTETDDGDELNTAVIYDEDEITRILNDINQDSDNEDDNGSEISSIHSSDDEEDFDGQLRQ